MRGSGDEEIMAASIKKRKWNRNSRMRDMRRVTDVRKKMGIYRRKGEVIKGVGEC